MTTVITFREEFRLYYYKCLEGIKASPQADKLEVIFEEFDTISEDGISCWISVYNPTENTDHFGYPRSTSLNLLMPPSIRILNFIYEDERFFRKIEDMDCTVKQTPAIDFVKLIIDEYPQLAVDLTNEPYVFSINLLDWSASTVIEEL